MLIHKEIDLLLNDLIEFYGYDFTGYSKPMLQRRINRLYKLRKFSGFAEFRYKLSVDAEYFRWFINELMVPVTEMFRDPTFFYVLRKEILPELSSLPLIRIWHSGCSSGEEVYSMAILLKELGLLHKTLIYATDINPEALRNAAEGVFRLKSMKLYEENYHLAGGEEDFSTYYTEDFGRAKFDVSLKNRVVFSTHNLVADTSFNQFQLIICRNVLIYFDRELQNRVFSLFDASLAQNGFLALGSKETLRFADVHNGYRNINPKEKIWKKI